MLSFFAPALLGVVASFVKTLPQVGSALCMIANKISYVWGLHGASLTLDTACSSSMTALHLGRESILSGDSDLSIIVGVNVAMGPSPFVAFSQAQMLSPTGTSRPFDAKANGFVRAEGCGVVVLCSDAWLARNGCKGTGL